MRLDIKCEHLLRELAPQVLGAVIRRFHDFGAGEDAVQDALVAAAIQWPREGVPENPRGWLIQVAVRRMTDYLAQRGGAAAPRSRSGYTDELHRTRNRFQRWRR